MTAFGRVARLDDECLPGHLVQDSRKRRVVHVVPHLPPSPEGVGSFAAVLAEALRDRYDVESRFLVASPFSSARPAGVRVPAVQLKAAEPGALCAALAEATGNGAGAIAVLLHYVNYGYERRGCPTWLVEGLARWKRERADHRVVTLFHEVYASGPFWRSSFWLLPRQRRLAARLLHLSDAAATSMELQAGILRRWRPEEAIAVNPVFSTIGEPAAVPPLAGRPRRLIVFGGPGARQRAWKELLVELLATCRMLGIEEVWDAGPPVGIPARFAGPPVRELGVLDAAEASARLLEGCAGFVAYPPDLLGKSTTFAAYCAHGLLPICAWRRPQRHRRGSLVPFWQPRAGAAIDWRELQAIADRAHSWYRGHSLDHHATAYMKLLFPRTSADPRPDVA